LDWTPHLIKQGEASVAMASVKSEPERSLDMMKSTDAWPIYGILCVKRRRTGEWPELGFMTKWDGAQVSLGCIYMLPQDCETIQYDSFESAISDGWEVD
jgi:hypothetical protein